MLFTLITTKYPSGLSSLQSAADYVHTHNRDMALYSQFVVFPKEKKAYDYYFLPFIEQTQKAHKMWEEARSRSDSSPEAVRRLKDSVEWQNHLQTMLDTAREVQGCLETIPLERSRVHRGRIKNFIKEAECELGQEPGRWAVM